MSIADNIIQKYKGQQQSNVADRIIQKYKTANKQGSVADRIIQKYKQETPKENSNMVGSAWNWTTNQLIKPVSMASNALEDTGKMIAYPIAKSLGYKGNFQDAQKLLDIHPLQHQQDVLNGKNKRTYSTFANEIADKEQNPFLKYGLKTIGYTGDFALDPLNKVKILGLTGKGEEALKLGKLGLSAAEQANKGERALLQLGKYNVLPKVGNRILAASTMANDSLRGTEIGSKVFNVGAALSGKIRPSGVTREEFKILTDAKNAARNTTGYMTDKAIDFAKNIQKTLVNRKATDEERKQLLHAIEKGDEKLAPVAFQDIWKQGVDFKNSNEELWKSLGGATLDNYGLAHVATKEVVDAEKKNALKGGKIYSPITPQDQHRNWMKVDGKITNIEDKGIKYDPVRGFVEPRAVETKPGVYTNKYVPVKTEQASANEINKFLEKQGKSPIFQEDVPIVVAKMGISTGKKQAGVDFLKATEGLQGEEAKKLANETYQKMTNNEAIAKAIQAFDSVQNIWKAQALISPSYHIRNMAGNLWNNYLADVHTPAYAMAGNIQRKMVSGNLTEQEAKLVDDMAKHGVLGTGWFGSDISQEVGKELGKSNLNPFSQKFAGYRLNRAIGSGVEDNAKIAHYISKIADGYTPQAAAESVKKYLFDYGDLTSTEKGLLKRVMPFYTWTSKNIPLQIQQFIEKPGKFSKISTVKKDIEENIPMPNEKYMSDYISSNQPIRIRQTPDGNTEYFLMGSWLPAASALNAISDPLGAITGMISPLAKTPMETVLNKSSFFKDTLGNYDNLSKFPGQKTSYLGMDIDPRLANVLRSLRPLNEIDKLNPGNIFGTQNSPSIFKGILDNASNQRGGKYTPESSMNDRISNAFLGKLQKYNPRDAKYFYDRDTQTRVAGYDADIKRALKNKQLDLAQKIAEEKRMFLQKRNGVKQNKPYYTP